MGPSGMPAAPEVSRLPPPGSQATEPEGGSGAERRGAGQGRHARTHTRQSLDRKNLWKYGETRGGPVKQRGAGCTCKQGASLGANNTVGRMDTLTTCFCSLLAHDFPLLLTTVVPSSTRQDHSLDNIWKSQKKWTHLYNVVGIS